MGRQQYVPTKDATVVARVRERRRDPARQDQHAGVHAGRARRHQHVEQSAVRRRRTIPYDLTRSTAGSSGGAGASVAAGLAAFDIGSDWGGSIRGPSHNNGIAGIKPTSVRVPRTGHIVDYGGIFDLWQQFGPMARRVEDLALITPIISGPDFRDASCAPVPWADPAAVDRQKLRDRVRRRQRRDGRDAMRTEEDTKKAVREAVGGCEGTVASVQRGCAEGACSCSSPTRAASLRSGDGGAFYQRLADKWGTKNFSPLREARTMATAAASDARRDGARPGKTTTTASRGCSRG